LTVRPKTRNAGGSPSVGLFIRSLKSRAVVELVDLLDVEVVVIDAEHEAWDPEALATISGHAQAAKTTILVRVATSSYADVARPLDDGADGVVVPRIESAAEAAAVVRAARQPPAGARGVALRGALRATDERASLSARLAALNRHVQVILQLETGTAIDRVDEIAGTSGIDGLLVGLTDLSCSLGFPDEPNHPDVEKLVSKVLEACRKHGRSAGVAGPRDSIAQWGPRGASLLFIGVDSELLIACVRKQAHKLRAAGC
jgi:4-hydroxy-2-oxoheptanedioate aldolase